MLNGTRIYIGAWATVHKRLRPGKGDEMITDLMDEYLNTLEDNGEDIEYYLSYKELVEMVFDEFKVFINNKNPHQD